MKRTLPAVALALLISLTAACGDDSGESDEGSGDSGGRQAGEKPVTTVQEQGVEPRARLLIDVEAGHRETTVMTLDQRIDSGGQIVDAPPIELTLTNEVLGVDDDGIEVRTTYGGARVTEPDDPAAADIESALAGIDGLSSTTTFTASGGVVDSELVVPDDLEPVIKQAVEQFGDQAASLTIAFPEQEVGVGATWTATSSLELSGVQVDQTTTYELVSLEGDDYEISVMVSQDYQAGPAEGFDVDSGEGTTSGTMAGTIGNLVPTRSTSSGSTQVAVSVGSQTQDVSTTVELTVTSTVD